MSNSLGSFFTVFYQNMVVNPDSKPSVKMFTNRAEAMDFTRTLNEDTRADVYLCRLQCQKEAKFSKQQKGGA